MTLTALSEQELASRSEAAGEPTWLRDARLAAFKRWADQDWPNSRRDEYWRSTPFTRFDVDVDLVGDGGDVPTCDLEGRSGVACIADGKVGCVRLTEAAEAAGVVLADLATAASEHEHLVRPHLGSLTTLAQDSTGRDEDRTITSSDAAWTAGVVLHVPAEVELDEPVVIRVQADAAGAHLPRVLVVLEHHAKATVELEHVGDGPALVDEVAEFIVGDGASLDVATLQEWGDDVDHLSLQKAQLQRAATYRHLAVQVGGGTVRLRPEVDLVGEGASCEPLGLYFADDGQWFDLQPYIRHIAPRASSDVLFKGALQGRSKTVFRGNVWVGEEAVGTDTNETNRSLILTDGAKADSTPFLEIFCSDIKAGHGSATGQLDEDHLFYLQARGIARDEAVRLIVYGFFREVLERFALDDVRDRTLTHIEREIASADLDALGVRQRQAAPGADPEVA